MDEFPQQDPNFNPEIFENVINSFVKFIDSYIEPGEKTLNELNKLRHELNLIKNVININDPEFKEFIFKDIFKYFENCIVDYKDYINGRTKNISNFLSVAAYNLGFEEFTIEITTKDLLNYCKKLKNMNINEVVSDISFVLNIIDIFINKDVEKFSEFLNNKNIKEIFTKLLFFTFSASRNEKRLFIEYLPIEILKDATFSRVPEKNIEKLKTVEPVIKQLINLQLDYFLHEILYKYQNIHKLISLYVLYFLTLTTFEFGKKDFFKLYDNILRDVCRNKIDAEEIALILDNTIKSIIENYHEKRSIRLDFSRLNHEDFLFALVRLFRRDLLEYIDAAVQTYKVLVGRELSEEEEGRIKLIYIEKLKPYKNHIYSLISNYISDEKILEKCLKILAHVEDFSKEIEDLVVPIENNEGELVKN